MITHMQQVGRALFDGLRSAVLLKPREGAFEVSLGAVVTVCLLSMAATAALEFAMADGAGLFNPRGIIASIATLGVLLAYICLGSVVWGGALAGRLFAGVTAISAVLMAIVAGAVYGIARVAGTPSEGSLLASIWPMAGLALLLVLLFAAVCRLGFGLAPRWRVAAGLGLVAVDLLAAVTLPNTPIFYNPASPPLEFSLLQTAVDILRPARQPAGDESDANKPAPIDVEATLHQQPDRMAVALAKLQPSTREQGDFYFIGMAPYASQDVFKREIGSVKALFDGRFETAGRSLALINHRDSVGDLPLASMSNLDMALRHFGRIMRADRDVLVLFVTSHGTNGEISVSFPGFPLNEMTPDRLAASLDRAGIINRVLVLSACHSGSFVERLKNDTTLIMTAAHADKTSFGCSNENEWTYFGDAYFNRTLRTETSLIDAFGKARALIEEWEKRDGLVASDPQMFAGSAIKQRLDAMTAGRFAAQAK